MALRETTDYLENLLNYANAPIIVWDSEFRITKFNKAFEQLSGRNASAVLGQKVDILFPSSTREQSLEYINKTSAGNRWEVVEIEIQHVDGSVRALLWNSASIYLPDGKTVSATIAQGQDITERRRARDEIIRLNSELEKKVSVQNEDLSNNQIALLNLVDDLNQITKKITDANLSLEATNKELTSFSYSVSHDLRAPLRSIDGFSHALLEDYTDKLDDNGKNYLARIRRATQHMGQLIDDMLNLSRVTQSEFNFQVFNLSTMVRNIAHKKQEESPLENLILDIQEDIVVRADQHMMNIAMTNLLDNAFKFTGKIKHPRIQFAADVINGERVIFIRDNGVGFDMTYAEKLFVAFHRLHRTEDFPGTGIGLAIVMRIFNRHGGLIWVEAEQGKGATFYFTLPE